MEQNRKKMRFEVFFERYFTNFPRILLTNLIFFVPLSIAVSLLYLGYYILNMYTPLLTMALVTILFTLIFPFYAGLVMVCRNIARGDEKVKVFRTFIKGVKENFKMFLLYGLMASVVFILSYFSIFIYSTLLSQSWLFYIAMFICIIIDVALLFVFFYVPIMTVTFELSLKNILKNSLLMSFGEIKNNLSAVFAMIVIFAICFTLMVFATYPWLLITVIVLIFALLLPASLQFAISYYVYDDMYSSIAMNKKKAQALSKKISDSKNGTKTEEEPTIEDDYSDVDISTLKDNDDFIFYNGKMIRQSELLKRVKSQRENTGMKE